MRHPRPALLPLVTLLALAGCGSDVSRAFGLVRDAPDEFTVVTQAPLSMPPTYMLEPPRPGAPRPQDTAPARAAEEALVPQTALAAPATRGPMTPGEQALVQAAGPPPPADIRASVDQLAAADAPKPGLTDKLLFWTLPKQPGIVVDPQKESQRLRESAALGQSEEASPTPIIKPKRRTIFGF
jgi:hypothetical protein